MDLSRFTTIHPPPVAVSPASKDQQISIEGILTERKDLAVKEGNEISPGKEGDLAERNPALGISVSPTGRHYPGAGQRGGGAGSTASQSAKQELDPHTVFYQLVTT